MKTKSEIEKQECAGWVVMYLAVACWVFFTTSQLFGVALLGNAVLAIGIGMIARNMGKQETPAILLGLIAGPLGALAGLIAAKPRE